ncbi:TAXI family TRAP transporter solute-binding subunit [Chloroflexota bacterium]
MKNRKLLILISSICLVLVFALLPLIAACAGTPAETRITVVGAAATSTTYAWGTAFALLGENHSDWLKMDLVPCKGSVESLRFLIEGKGSVAQSYEWISNDARAGIDAFADLGPKDNYRTIFNSQVPGGVAVVLDSNPIEAITYESLKGKTVATRQVGSAGIILCTEALKALGLDPKTDVKLLTMGQGDCNSAILDGTADIFIGVLGFNHKTMIELSTTKPVRFLPIPKGVMDKLGEEISAVPGEIPAGMYKGQDEAVATPRMVQYWYAGEDVDDDIVYELVRLWWTYPDERNEVHPTIRDFATVDWVKTAIPAAKTAIHPGALKYYKEQGWLN